MYHLRMKYRKPLIIAVVLVLVCSFSSCTAPGVEEDHSISPGIKETSVFIASDLHLYSENLIGPDNQLCIKENMSSDGRVQEYDYELLDALIQEVNEEKPDYLILTGDLSYNGEPDSHREIAKLLKEIEGTKVLVIPGNHDMYSLSSFSSLEDKTKRIASIDMEDFREIYNDYGYEGAYSYDKDSLSYIYELSEDTWAVMLDTTLSELNETMDLNIVGGFLDESTLLWLEDHLKYAKENGISVVSFSHHNLLVHNELFQTSHTLTNYKELLEIYSQYNVDLNLSGHLHIQSIQSETLNESEFHDISSGSLLAYGNRYGRLDIYDNCYSYESCPVVFEDREYSFQVFCQEYYDKTVNKYQKVLGEENGEAVTALLSEINTYYFDGSYEQIHDLIDNNKQLVKMIKKSTAEYDASYIKSIMEVEDKNQHSLIVERNK